MEKQKMINVLNMIIDDMENDAKRFEGSEFNGRNVAEYLGNLGAAVSGLANIIKEHIESKE